MSQPLATLTVKNSDNPPPTHPAAVNQGLEEDCALEGKTQPGSCRAGRYYHVHTWSYDLLFSAARIESTVIGCQGLRNHCGLPL